MRTETPRERSPYGLIQEDLRDEPWRLLVAVMMLNQTSAKQARPVWERFFETFPAPEQLYQVSPDRSLPMLESMLRSLGFQKRRSERIWLMTEQFLFDWDGKDPLELYGIGKYGADSYNIFVEGRLPVSEADVDDKELKHYVRWANHRGAEDV